MCTYLTRSFVGNKYLPFCRTESKGRSVPSRKGLSVVGCCKPVCNFIRHISMHMQSIDFVCNNKVSMCQPKDQKHLGLRRVSVFCTLVLWNLFQTVEKANIVSYPLNNFSTCLSACLNFSQVLVVSTLFQLPLFFVDQLRFKLCPSS